MNNMTENELMRLIRRMVDEKNCFLIMDGQSSYASLDSSEPFISSDNENNYAGLSEARIVTRDMFELRFIDSDGEEHLLEFANYTRIDWNEED